MSEGIFVVASGGEGSGKTTILRMLKEEFPHIVVTREPGGTPVGQRIRGILLDDATLDPDVMTESYLFTADRVENVARVILPALDSGRTLIDDRHWQDTCAYQWYATMGQTNHLEFMARCVDPKWPKPTLWLWFDVDPATGLQRRRNTSELNRLDERDLAFHTRVHKGFEWVYSWYPYPKVRIDANQSINEVYASVKAALAAYLS